MDQHESTQARFGVPGEAIRALQAMGYEPDTRMAGHVNAWWQWYTSTAAFYDGDRTIHGSGGRPNVVQRVRRRTIHPARRVCVEWASLLLDDETTVAAVGEGADAALSAWLSEVKFLERGQQLVERAFATGTGAWALSFSVSDGVLVGIVPRRYDARQVVPLSWDEDNCSECAFCEVTHVRGRAVTQLVAHVMDGVTGTYHVRTMAWDDDGRALDVEALGFIADFDTGCPTPTFALVRPAIGNVYEDGSAMGQSVFADATGAIEAVDNAFDSICREMDATKVKTFMADQLFSPEDTGEYDEDGRPVRSVRPMSPDDELVRVTSQDGDLIKTYSPEIRIEPLRTALDVALDRLGDLCGFGQQYFCMDRKGGMKTATEVTMDNSELMRNIAKHEKPLRAAISTVCEAALWCMGFTGEAVTVEFDDSVIEDTATDKAQMMGEVAAGLVPAWMYLARFYGMTEERAREVVAEAQGGAAVPAPPEE